MLHSADVIFGALSRILAKAAFHADDMPDVFLFTVRLAVSLEEFAQAADTQRNAVAAFASSRGYQRVRAGSTAPHLAREARERMLTYLGSHASARIRVWLSTARHEDIAMHIEMHAHLALIAAVQIGAIRITREHITRRTFDVQPPRSITRKKPARTGGDGGGSDGGYDALINAFSVSSAFVLSWMSKQSSAATCRPHVISAIFAAIQKNAAETARWSLDPANTAACDYVLTRMKAVVIDRAPLWNNLAGEAWPSDGRDKWQPQTPHVAMCRTVLSSPTAVLANSDVYEAITFPGATFISISFSDDTRLVDGDWVCFYKVLSCHSPTVHILNEMSIAHDPVDPAHTTFPGRLTNRALVGQVRADGPVLAIAARPVRQPPPCRRCRSALLSFPHGQPHATPEDGLHDHVAGDIIAVMVSTRWLITPSLPESQYPATGSIREGYGKDRR